MARLVFGAVALATLLLSAARAPYAHPREDRPICRAPSVIDVMTRALRQRDHYARIEPRLIAEYPGTAPNTVRCGVWVQTLRYDAALSGDVPLRYGVSHEFQVRALPGGYVVTFVR